MNKIWVVARREYLATVRTRAFLISLFMMPVMMGLGAVIGVVTRRMEDDQERRFVVIDRTPGAKVFPLLEAAAKLRNDEMAGLKDKSRKGPAFKLEKMDPEADLDMQRLALSERVRKGELTGFLEIGPEAMSQALTFGDILKGLIGGKPKPKKEKPADPLSDPALTRYQARVTNPGAMEFYRWAAMEVSLATRLGPKALDPATRQAMAEQKVPLVMLDLSVKGADGTVKTEEGMGKSMTRIFVGIGCIMLMFVIIFAVATPMMQGVLEEKMQRISEVLLGSVTPFQLMAGKLVGGVGVALTLAAVYLGGAYWALHHYGFADQVPPALIGWFLFYMVLALLMYGSLFMAVGAACTDMKEPQTLMLPVMLPAMLPLFLLGPIMSNPDSVLSRGASFFPPATPMLMVARQGLSANIAWWEPVVGSVLVLAFTALCVWMAGRIFRVGMLVQGKGATFGEMVGWAFRA